MVRCMALAAVMMFAVLANSTQAAGEKEQKVKLTKCPPAVQKTLQREAKGSKIEEVMKTKEDGETIYESSVLIKGKKYNIEVASSGKLLSISTKVKISDLPESVRKTLMDEVGKGELEKYAEREVENHKTFYEAKAEINEKDYEIVIAENGTLIKKVLVAEEKEEGNEQAGKNENKEGDKD